MATITWTADRNYRVDAVTETNGSGKTMTTGIEVNIDKAKIIEPQEAVAALQKIIEAILESVNMRG